MESELDVLQSIYQELVIHEPDTGSSRPRGAHLDIAIVLDKPTTVTFEKAPALKDILYLPPLQFRVELPEEYPISVPPIIRLECVWLPETLLDTLLKDCLALWEPEMEVLFAMVDHLVQLAGTEFSFLDESAAQIGPMPDALFPIINAHQHEASQEVFDARSFACEICLDVHAGSQCVALDCGHVFCKACLGEMFSLHIREGATSLVRCPNCPAPKDPSPDMLMQKLSLQENETMSHRMPASILQRLVSPDYVSRYQHLARKQELEALPSHTHCPRDWCATALARDPDEKLVVCTACSYAFCADCGRTWHGVSEPCRRMKLSFALAEQYVACGDDVSAKIKLERMYGRKNLERLVRDMEDERLADNWRRDNAQQCPACESWVQKSMGCNHMSCIVCRCHFCFLCGDALSSRNPYVHYGDKGLSCYGKLFEGLTGLEGPYGEF